MTDKLRELRAKNEGLVEEIETALTAQAAEVGIEAMVSGREKKPYSIWRKMENKQISSGATVRHLCVPRDVPRISTDCYRVLGVAHTTWRAVPGRFKDYISTPKQNNYQSIHTTVVGPRHQRVELQIRTHVMHQVAEYGVAAHALYKDMTQRRYCRRLDDVASTTRSMSPYVVAAADGRNAAGRLEPGRVSGAHQARALPGSGVLLHAEGPAHRTCRAGRRRSISLTPCIRMSATRRLAPMSTAGMCRSTRGCGTATKSRSGPQGACAAGGVGEPVRHRPGAERYSPGSARSGSPPVCGIGTAACDGGVRGGARDLHRRRGEARPVEVHAQISR